MFSYTVRRGCSLLLHPVTRPAPLSRSLTTSITRRPPSQLVRPTAAITTPHTRSFASGPNEPDDPIEDYIDAIPPDQEQDELVDKLDRELERGPSKAERLRMKEKEKRRQKLAMRERVDNKKDKVVGKGAMSKPIGAGGRWRTS